jgi:hypothetical protein
MNQFDQMAQMFAATDVDGRRYVMAILKHEYERTQRRHRPTLRLIPGGVQSPTELSSTRPVVCIQNTGER